MRRAEFGESGAEIVSGLGYKRVRLTAVPALTLWGPRRRKGEQPEATAGIGRGLGALVRPIQVLGRT